MSLLVAFVSAAVYFKTSTQYNDYRATIRAVLKDPGSAEFKDERVSSSGTYCAEVNSKNSYGGYIGFDRVMSDSKSSDGKSYVFFEKDGVLGNNIERSIILLELEGEELKVKNIAMEKRILGVENIEKPSDFDAQKIALRHVFEKRWSEKCLNQAPQKNKETGKTALLNSPEQLSPMQESPTPPMPANAEHDKYAKQGWSCKAGFEEVNSSQQIRGCEKQAKSRAKL